MLRSKLVKLVWVECAVAAGYKVPCCMCCVFTELILNPITAHGVAFHRIKMSGVHQIHSQSCKQVNNTRVKGQTNNILKAILDRDNMIEEVNPKRNENIIHVKLHDVEDKINIMSQRHLCNNTCQISEYKRKTSSQIDVPHSKYCKFILGLPNSSSAMGALNELHRIPMTIKAAIRNILYWHRLENNTTTAPLLNEAYKERKRKGHMFYQNLKYTLKTNGMGGIRLIVGFQPLMVICSVSATF